MRTQPAVAQAQGAEVTKRPVAVLTARWHGRHTWGRWRPNADWVPQNPEPVLFLCSLCLSCQDRKAAPTTPYPQRKQSPRHSADSHEKYEKQCFPDCGLWFITGSTEWISPPPFFLNKETEPNRIEQNKMQISGYVAERRSQFCVVNVLFEFFKYKWVCTRLWGEIYFPIFHGSWSQMFGKLWSAGSSG